MVAALNDAGFRECIAVATEPIDKLPSCNRVAVSVPDLRELVLNGTPLRDAGLEGVGGLTTLRGLELEGTRVGDAGLAHLKGLTRLRKLQLQ